MMMLLGTGFLLIQGAFGVMVGTSPAFHNFTLFFTPEALIRWVPSFIFGFTLVIGTRFYKHFLTLPILLMVATLIFYSVAFANGQTIESLRATNSLLGPFPQGNMLKSIDFALSK